MDKVSNFLASPEQPGLNKIYLCNKQIIFNLYVMVYVYTVLMTVVKLVKSGQSLEYQGAAASAGWNCPNSRCSLPTQVGQYYFYPGVSPASHWIYKPTTKDESWDHLIIMSPPNFTRQTGLLVSHVEFWDQVQPIFHNIEKWFLALLLLLKSGLETN